MTEQFQNIAQKIIDAHPERVHQLLRAKGISKKATPEVLLNTFILFGNPFISELVDIAFTKKVKTSNITGLEFVDWNNLFDTAVSTKATVTNEPAVDYPPVPKSYFNDSVEEGSAKKTFWDNVSGLFNSAANLGNSVNDIIKTTKGIAMPIGKNDQAPFDFTATAEAKKAASEKNTKTILIIGIIVVVILIALILILKKRS